MKRLSISFQQNQDSLCSMKMDQSVNLLIQRKLKASKLEYLNCLKQSYSTTVEEQLQWKHQRQKVMKILTSDNQCSKNEQINQMVSELQSIHQSERLKFLKLEQNQKDLQGLVLNHYFGAWLLSMGYQSEKNRKYILSRIYLQLGRQYLPLAQKCYSTMFGQLQNTKRISIVLSICKNGWQYMIKKILKHIQLEKLSKEFNKDAK